MSSEAHMVLTSIMTWLAVSIAMMAVIEYTLHRWVLHNFRGARLVMSWKTFESHTLLHHMRYYRDFDYDDDLAAKHVSVDIIPGYSALGLSPVWLSMWYFWSMTAGLSFLAVVIIHAWLSSLLHNEMHEPMNRWWSNTWPYRYIRAYHRRHHQRPDTNFCALFPPVMDLVMGTYGGVAYDVAIKVGSMREVIAEADEVLFPQRDRLPNAFLTIITDNVTTSYGEGEECCGEQDSNEMPKLKLYKPIDD